MELSCGTNHTFGGTSPVLIPSSSITRLGTLFGNGTLHFGPPMALPSDIGPMKREANILDTAIWRRMQGKLILVGKGVLSVG